MHLRERQKRISMAQAHLAAPFTPRTWGLTKPKAPWGDGAAISRTGVLVGRDGHKLQHPLSACPVQALGP